MRNRHKVTIIDMQNSSRLVLAIMSMVAMMVIPDLCDAEEKTKYAGWLDYKNNLCKDSNLALYYDFEEGEGTALKNKAVGPKPDRLNGTLLGAAWTAGRWTGKKALEFDGSNDYVDCGNDANRILNITGAITIEAWIKSPIPGGHGYYHIVSKFSDSSDQAKNGYVLQVESNDKVSFYLWGGGSPYNVVSRSAISPDTWYHVVGRFDGAVMELFINGVSQSTYSYSVKIGDNSVNPLYCGKMPGGGNYYKGIIDEIAIYSRVLRDEEIKNHYETGRP